MTSTKFYILNVQHIGRSSCTILNIIKAGGLKASKPSSYQETQSVTSRLDHDIYDDNHHQLETQSP